MKIDSFPLNYFRSIWTPKRAFKNRKQLTIIQTIIVILFLNGLMMIPVTLHYARMDSFPIEGTFPNVFRLIDESLISEMHEATFLEGEMILDTGFYEVSDSGVVGANVSQKDLEGVLSSEEHALFFQENEFILKEGEEISKVRYTENFSLEGISSVEEVKMELSQQWFIQNQIYIMATFSFLVSMLMLVSTVLIVLGSALFIYLTKKNAASSIETYKESINLILLALGLPTLASMLIGLVIFDIGTMIMIQSFGLVFMILAVFCTTRFSDKKICKKEKSGLGVTYND